MYVVKKIQIKIQNIARDTKMTNGHQCDNGPNLKPNLCCVLFIVEFVIYVSQAMFQILISNFVTTYNGVVSMCWIFLEFFEHLKMCY